MAACSSVCSASAALRSHLQRVVCSLHTPSTKACMPCIPYRYHRICCQTCDSCVQMKTTLNAIGEQRISAGGLGGAGCAAEKRGGSFAGERDGSFTGGRGGGLDVGQGGSSAGDSGRVVGSIEIDDSMEYPAIERFDGIGLSENLLRGIYSYGFERPSTIQQRAIRPMKTLPR